jgi:hypothetical protein
VQPCTKSPSPMIPTATRSLDSRAIAAPMTIPGPDPRPAPPSYPR